MSGIPISTLTPLTNLAKESLRRLSPEEEAVFREEFDARLTDFHTRMLKSLERRYSEPVDLANHPSQQLYATIKSPDGRTIATIYNGGATSSSNAIGGQLSGMPGEGAEARAEWIARKFGGRIELAPTAMSDAAFKRVPPVRFELNREALEADPIYQLSRKWLADRQPISDTVHTTLLETQETTYDFKNMTRQQIADAGKQLFKEGHITLDELFRFEHPDGKLKIDLAGNRTELNPNDRIDFIAETMAAIRNLEQTGHAWLPKSPYDMMKGLLAKLTALQGVAAA